jgi:hypothetical protein
MEENLSSHLAETRMLDFNSRSIGSLIERRGWLTLPPWERARAAYDFVRNSILFGYNISDDIPASQVLADGYGQCNTKATLLMALFRGIELPCRLHGFTIHKSLQRGVVPELVYGLAPDEIIHSWVEVHLKGRWVNLEGFILDAGFLSALQSRFAGETDSLCGFGAGTDCLSRPAVEWTGADTYIQSTGINRDLGIFSSPDEFYARHEQAFGPVRGFFYRSFIRHWMNARVRAIRAGDVPRLPGAANTHSHPALPERLGVRQ